MTPQSIDSIRPTSRFLVQDMAAVKVENSTSEDSNVVESNSSSANANLSSRSNNTTDPDFDIYAGDNEFAEVRSP